MDGMAALALAFVCGVILGSGGTYVFLASGRRKKDMARVESELDRIDGNIRKMDRNFRLFLEDCKNMSGQAQDSMARSASALDAISMDLHAKLSVQTDKITSVDEIVQAMSSGIPERFDVLDGAHREIGANIERILDRVKETP